MTKAGNFFIIRPVEPNPRHVLIQAGETLTCRGFNLFLIKMSLHDRVAILLDGGYVKKQLYSQLKKFPSVSDIEAIPARIMANSELSNFQLYRVYYYDAEPYSGTQTNPLDRQTTNFAETAHAKQNRTLINQVEHLPNFAVRRGTLVFHGWELGRQAVKRITRTKQPTVGGSDLVPKLEQKGVDMRIGLDIATLALKRQVTAIVLVSGDSDMLPAMKCARREGLRVYLDTMGSPAVRDELKVHADRII